MDHHRKRPRGGGGGKSSKPPPLTKRHGVLRKSCDACSRAKVKCDGNKPCSKCQSRNVPCAFSVEQKRGPRAKPAAATPANAAAASFSSSTSSASSSAGSSPSSTAMPSPTLLAPLSLLSAAPPPPPPLHAAPASSLMMSSAAHLLGGGGGGGAYNTISPPTSIASLAAAAAAMAAAASCASSSSSSSPHLLQRPLAPPAPLAPAAAAAAAALVLSPAHQKRLFIIIFSLFKFHRDGSDLVWFAVRLAQLSGTLPARSRSRVLLGLVIARYQLCAPPIMALMGGGGQAAAPPRLALINLPRCVPPLALPNQQQQPPTFLGSIQVDARGGGVRCSPELTHWLAYNQDGTNLPNNTNNNGEEEMLPWGADVLCAVCDNDSQVLSYLRDAALALQQPQQSASASPIVTVTLLDRRITLKPAANHNAHNNNGSLACFMSTQITINQHQDRAWTSVCFYFFLPAGMSHTPGIELRDLELPPASVVAVEGEGDWLERLLQWSR